MQLNGIIFLACRFFTVGASTMVSATITSLAVVSRPAGTPLPNGTCDARIINYITGNTFATLCFNRPSSPDITQSNQVPSGTTSASNAFVASPTTTDTILPTATLVKTPNTKAEAAMSELLAQPTLLAEPDDEEGALDSSSFLSFEDWKKQTLEKARSDPDVTNPAGEAEKRKRPETISDSLDSMVDDGEIDIDFGAFLGDRTGDTGPLPSQVEDESASKLGQGAEDGINRVERVRYRSKDAGKTCKERFNFASLDAGGQIMKTNTEATSASALLRENRDVYMLNECQAKNKFLIVELSESILVETVAIANFEFFSSTFRQFHLSVSDRYPQKLDRWIDLGTFEAKNSRDIQAFLVEDPRIWARYLRVEFLNHYGNEFYCPVSLLRVHGKTMIQDILYMDQAAGNEDDADDDTEDLQEGQGEKMVPEAIADVLQKEKLTEDLKGANAASEDRSKMAEAGPPADSEDTLSSSRRMDVKQLLGNALLENTTTPWKRSNMGHEALFSQARTASQCLLSDLPALHTGESHHHAENRNNFMSDETTVPLKNVTFSQATLSSPLIITPHQTQSIKIVEEVNKPVPSINSMAPNLSTAPSIVISQPSEIPTSVHHGILNTTGASVNKISAGSVTSINKTSSTSSSHATQPTTQESFFKTVSKRLQLLETNSTLSLKYIEEQSKILREAFTKVEKRQLRKTTSFLENLNSTVLAELRRFGQQYDQMWQSTVIELESQRDQSAREAAAVTARLSILADELVFQKRMSIVQSILLLLCLCLVVFSRYLGTGYLDVPSVHSLLQKSQGIPRLALDSPSGSPTIRRTRSSQETSWFRNDHRRELSDEFADTVTSRERGEPSPISFVIYPDQDHAVEQYKGRRNFKTEVQHDLSDPSPTESIPSGYFDGSMCIPRVTEYQAAIHGEAPPPSFRSRSFSASVGPLEPSTSDRPGEVMGNYGQGDDRNYLRRSQPYNWSESYGSQNHSGGRQGIVTNSTSSQHLPSPPPDDDKRTFSIARKPLPALPIND